MKTRKLYRDARTGRFCSLARVKRSPKTTVTETVRAAKAKRRCS